MTYLVSAPPGENAYVLARMNGESTKPVIGMGSFESWTDCIRQMVMWLGVPDPLITHQLTNDECALLVSGLQQYLSAYNKKECYTSDIIDSYNDCLSNFADKCPDLNLVMREIVESNKPLNKTLGYKLRFCKNKVVNGMKIVKTMKLANRKTWKVVPVTPAAAH